MILWPAFVAEYKRVVLRTKQGPHAVSVAKTLSVFHEHMNPRSLSQVNSKFITEFIGRRSRDRGQKAGSLISAASINKDLRNLRLVFITAVEWGQLDKGPKIQMLKEPRRLKRFVTAEHFAAMFAAAEKMTKPEMPNATAAVFIPDVLKKKG